MITTPHPTNGARGLALVYLTQDLLALYRRSWVIGRRTIAARGLWDQRRTMDRGMREQGMLLAR